MPNHVYNSVTFNGDAHALTRIMKKLGMPHTLSEGMLGFNFYNLIEPSDVAWYKSTDEGHTDNWYNWRIANWGPKWNAYDVNMYRSDDNESLVYHFSTAWSQPTGIIMALVDYMVEERFDVSMDWIFEEEQGWGGEYHYDLATGMSVVQEWDIPETHHELVERKGTCYCEGENPIFYDCPGYNEQDEEDLES